jgi:hypothetical protein
MAVRIQLRRDTSTNWSQNNPVLRPGEIGIETDTLKFKIGPAVVSPAIGTAWNSISSYANVVPSDLNATLSDYLLTSDLGDTVAELVDGNLYIPGLDVIFEGTNADAHEITLRAPEATADRTITLPDVTGTVVTTGDTGSVTNAMLAGSIANNKLTNSSVTINTNSLSLGGSLTLDTDDVSEGTTNQYFTNERAQDAVATAFSNGTHTNITITYNDNDNAISIAAAPGYTDEQAQDAVGNAVGNGLDYDDNTGAISVDPSEFALSAVGVPTADVSLNQYKITNLGSPTSANDAATKAYVDNTTAGLNFHAPVHAATTANLPATYDNGTSGVGATLTKLLPFEALVIDGHTLSVGERVLVKNQTTASENGIYQVTAVGDGSTAWVLTRATDSDNSPVGEMAYGDFCFVQQGSTNAGFGFILNTTGTITLGTTSISYVQFNAGQVVIAGNGLTEAVPGTISIDTLVTADVSTAQTFTNKTLTSPKINEDVAVTATATELNVLDGITASTAELNILDGVTASAAEVNVLDGITSSTAELNILDGVTASASEINILDGATLSTTELNYVDGVTSAIQTQLDGKVDESIITAKGDLYVGSASATLDNLAVGTDGYLLTADSNEALGVKWAAAPVSLPSQTGNNGKYLTTDGTSASWEYLPVRTGTATITANTATTIDTLTTEVAAEYTLCITQGPKIRTSKVIVNVDHVINASADMTEFAITETNGAISGVLVSVAYGIQGATLLVTVTDAATTNATVKFTRVTF